MLKKRYHEEEETTYLVVDTNEGEGTILCEAEDLEAVRENVDEAVENDKDIDDLKVYKVIEMGGIRRTIEFD